MQLFIYTDIFVRTMKLHFVIPVHSGLILNLDFRKREILKFENLRFSFVTLLLMDILKEKYSNLFILYFVYASKNMIILSNKFILGISKHKF